MNQGKLAIAMMVAIVMVIVKADNPMWVGSNLYYAAGLYQSDQDTLFSGLQSAGVKVLRVWLDGQDSGSTKGTNIQSYPNLEPDEVGQYNDTVLELVDGIMINAKNYGIKLLISMYSFNSLQANDTYGTQYTVEGFYENSDAISAFDARLTHVLNHQHTTLNQPWSQLSEYIFAFEAQNEAMIGLGQDYIQNNQQWQCDRATTIKGVLGSNSGILVTTGGESWLDESMQPDFFTCDSLDVIAIHAYGVGDFNTDKIQGYVQQAQQNGKLLIFQEWGACYWDTENNNCSVGNPLDSGTRAQNIQEWADAIALAGIPWFYWQILPNADPHYGSDYEIGINDQNWDTFLAVASNTSTYTTPFDFSSYLP